MSDISGFVGLYVQYIVLSIFVYTFLIKFYSVKIKERDPLNPTSQFTDFLLVWFAIVLPFLLPMLFYLIGYSAGYSGIPIEVGKTLNRSIKPFIAIFSIISGLIIAYEFLILKNWKLRICFLAFILSIIALVNFFRFFAP